MKKMFKKAFTLVELLVVIAILAALATVGIISFSAYTKKANNASDNTLLSQLNHTLVLMEDEPDTYHEMKEWLEDETGYPIDEISTFSKNCKYAWDITKNKLYLVEGSKIIEPSEDARELSEAEKANLFVPVSSSSEFEGDGAYKGFSIALRDDADISVCNITAGFDANDNAGVTAVNYTNNGTDPKDVVIRTNTFGTVLTVNGSNDDTVTHYGYAGKVTVSKVAQASYDEYGTVGRLINNDDSSVGHIAIKSGATVYQVVEAEGNDYFVTIEDGATVYGEEGTKIEGAVNTSTAGTSNDLFNEDAPTTCEHNNTHEVIDSEHVYEVCDECGYTVIRVRNTSTGDEVEKVVTDAIMPKATYSSDQVSLTTGESITASDIKGVATNEETGKTGKDVTPLVEKTPVIEEGQKIDTTCAHSFEKAGTTATCTEEGIATYKCSKCGLTYTQNDVALGHNYENKTCTRCGASQSAAQIGDTCYDTYEQAFAAISNTGVTTIKANQDYTFNTNIVCSIKNGQEVIFDLNGCKLDQVAPYASVAYFFHVEAGGKFTLMDSKGTGIITQNALLCSSKANKDKTDSNGTAVTYPGYPSYSSTVVGVHGTFIMMGGTLHNTTVAGSACYSIDTYSGGVVQITGGSMISDSCTSVRLALFSTTSETKGLISGGYIKGAYFGVQIQNFNTSANCGSLEITGGTFETTDTDGYNMCLYAGFSFTDSDMSGVKPIAIKGGTFKNDVAFSSYIPEANLEVSGGTFYGDVYSYNSSYKFITGGTFVYDEWDAGSKHYDNIDYSNYDAPYNTFEGYRDYLISYGYSNIVDNGDNTVDFDYIWEAGNNIDDFAIEEGYHATVSGDKSTFTVVKD